MIGLHKVNYVRGKRGRKPGQGFLIVNDPNQPGGTHGNAATVNVQQEVPPPVVTSADANDINIAKTFNDAMTQDPVAAAAAAAAITACDQEPDLQRVVYDTADKYMNPNMMTAVSQPVFPNLHDSESQHSQATVGQPMEAPPPPVMSPARIVTNPTHHVLQDTHTATNTPVTSHGEVFNLESLHTQMYMQPTDMGHPGHPGLYRFPANLPYLMQSTHPHGSYLHPHPQVPPAHSNPPSNDATTRSLIYSATNYTNWIAVVYAV